MISGEIPGVVENKYHQLCIDNSKLVITVMHSLGVFSSNPLYEDVYQEGMIGLYIACTRFDESLGFEFSTYAVSYIKGYILHFLGKASGLKLPKGLRETFSLYKNIIKDTDKTDEEQAIEISKLLAERGFNEIDIQNCWGTVSLDEPVKTVQEDSAPFSLLDMLESKANEIDKAIFRLDLELVKAELTRKFKKEVKLKIALDILNGLEYDVTQVEIAEKYGVTRQYVSLVYKEVVKIARKVLLGYA